MARPTQRALRPLLADRARCEKKRCGAPLVERGDRMVGTLTLVCPVCALVAAGLCACGCNQPHGGTGPSANRRYAPACAKRREREARDRYIRRHPERERACRRRQNKKPKARAQNTERARRRREDPAVRAAEAAAARKRRRTKAGRTYQLTYYAERREQRIAASKAWRLANPDRVKAAKARYRQDPDVLARDAAMARRRRREARLAQPDGAGTAPTPHAQAA